MLITVLALALAGGAALVCLASLVWAVECLVGAWPRGALPAPARPEGLRVAVLIPAHNEAARIGAAIEAARALLRQGDRILVVADNCVDDTAARSRGAGAEVVERNDQRLCGKGFALTCGVEALALGQPTPDVVIVLDADCTPTTGSLDALTAVATKRRAAVQSRYVLAAPKGTQSAGRVSAFAFRVRNWLRLRGRHRLRLPARLAGTGMAFPWPIIEQAPALGGHLAEDLALGTELALSGVPVVFCEQALVTSGLAPTAAAQRTQRERWERGHLQTIGTYLPRVVWRAVRGRRPGLLLLAADLLVPPLALLILLSAVGLAAGAVLGWLGADARAAQATFTVGLVAIAVAGLAAWYAVGRDLLRWSDVAWLPLHFARKLPSYGAWAMGKSAPGWVRTARPGEAAARPGRSLGGREPGETRTKE